MKIRRGRTNIWIYIVNGDLTITVKKNRGKQFSIEFTEDATQALSSLLQGGGARLPVIAETLPAHRETIVEGLHKEADGITEGMD